MLVVGPKDAEANTVSVRSRDAGELGAMPRDAFIAKLLAENVAPRA
jgi:threonyl-tRNA synthetase